MTMKHNLMKMSQTIEMITIDDLIKNQKNTFTVINLIAKQPCTIFGIHNKTGVPLSSCYKIIKDCKKLGIVYRNGMEIRENNIKPLPKYSSHIGNIQLTFEYVKQENRS